MAKGKKGTAKKKDKFDALSDEFKSAVQQSSPEEIKKRMYQIVNLEIEVRKQLKENPDVLQARNALRDVTEDYRNDLKSFRLQLEYSKLILDAIDGGAASAKAQESQS